jgi:thioesterase domain-containing protein
MGPVEVARQLAKSGKRVAFLGLIDSRGVGQQPPPDQNLLAKTTRRLSLIVLRPQYVVKELWARLTAFLWSVPARLNTFLWSVTPLWALLAIGQMTEVLSRKLASKLDGHLMRQVWRRAFGQYKIKALDFQMVLFRSEDAWGSADHGWSALCRHLTVVAVKGSHGTLFSPQNRDVLCAKFLEMINAAWQPQLQQPEQEAEVVTDKNCRT